jgi:arginine decarboxylase
MVFSRPDKYFLVSGFAEGPTLLNAFDNALIQAGIGNTNLMRISSILPPGAEEIPPIVLPYGSLVPIAYSYESSDKAGTLISAAVACGVPEDPSLPGVIMEHHQLGEEQMCREMVKKQVEAAFAVRKFKLAELKIISASGIVQVTGAAFAGVVLWS